MALGPCLNPNCKSHGRPHPNCLCYSAGPGYEGFFAHGGSVCSMGMPHREDCPHYAEGGPVSPEQVQEATAFHKDPELSVDHGIMTQGLRAALDSLSRCTLPATAAETFESSHRGGRKALKSLSGTLVEKGKGEPTPGDGKGLQSLLDGFKGNPESVLNIGGHLGSVYPEHATALAAKVGVASNYLDSLKPQPESTGPLDRPTKPSQIDRYQYDRQVEIVDNPANIYRHAKEGRLQPRDLQTLGTVYPKLYQEMKDKAFETLTAHKAKDGKLTRKMREGLAYLLGQPLSYVQTPMAAQAILNANKPTLPQPGSKQSNKASSAELTQINKVNKLDQTPLQARQANEKD